MNAISDFFDSVSTYVQEIPPQTQRYLFLIPTVSAIAIGILFMPGFGVGLAVGGAMFVATTIALNLLTSVGWIKDDEDENSLYSKLLNKNLLGVALFAPIAEEALFHGGLQPLLTYTIALIVPAASAALFGPMFTVATVVSIVATGVIFGAVHYLNPHKGAFEQAVLASIAGVAYGILTVQFGIGAAIAAHIVNNTICAMLMASKPAAPKPAEEPYPRQKFKFSPLPA